MRITLFILLIAFFSDHSYAQKQKVWIDADTGNETDDVFAIIRLLAEPSIELTGVSSAHFNNPDLLVFKMWNQYPTRNINTVQISQELNEEILGVMHQMSVPHPIGADRQIGRAWGGSEPRDSPAAEQLIKTVKSLRQNEKLDVICTGALTNLASAIQIDTSIIPRIRCYILGARYNIKKRAWDKNEFNIRNDLNAFDYILDTPKLNITVMPVNTALPFQMQRDSLYAGINQDSPPQNLLKKRWEETNPDDTIRVLWDLALVEAYLQPDLVNTVDVQAPPENMDRLIRIYSKIDSGELLHDFWQVIKAL